MSDPIYFKIQAWATNILIIIFSAIVLLKFTKLREKTGGLYMILVLTIADLSFPVMNALTIEFVNSNDSALLFAAISSFQNRFSLYWSAAIAIYTYQILVSRDFDEKVFIKKSFIITCAIVSIFPIIILLQLFGITIEYVGPGLYGISYPLHGLFDKMMYLLFLDFLGYVVPAIIIFTFYYRVSKTIKQSYGFIGASGEVSSTKSFSFAIIPIICFAPEVLSDCYYIFQGINIYPFGVILVVSLLHRSWGFLNLCAFWFLNPISRHSMSISTSDLGRHSDRYILEE